jgi:hypothetical protein
LSSGSFSDLIKAVLSTKSSNFLYKSGNNKALLDKKSLTTNYLTVLKPKVAGTLGPVFIVCRQNHFMPYML